MKPRIVKVAEPRIIAITQESFDRTGVFAIVLNNHFKIGGFERKKEGQAFNKIRVAIVSRYHYAY